MNHRVAMFHFGRSGSQVLSHLIGAQPAVFWDGEIFRRLHEGKLHQEEAERFQDPLGELRRRTENCTAAIYGFETKFQHLDRRKINLPLAAYCERLVELGFDRFILLRRSNYLRQAISIRRGMRDKKWHYRSGDRPPENPAVCLDVDRVVIGGPGEPLLRRFEKLDTVYAEARAILGARPFLELEYERHLYEDPRVALELLCRFVDLDPVPVEPDLSRIGGQTIRQLLENYDDVAKLLRGSPFEWMLEGER